MGKRNNNRVKKEFFEKEKEKKDKVQSSSNKTQIKKASKSSKDELEYVNFFLSKESKKIILYDDWPTIDTIINYYANTTWSNLHPLEEYGKFEIKELLEVIKLLYSIKRQQTYNILTTGFLTESTYTVLEGTYKELLPHLYFMIGNSQTLEPYTPYQNLFQEEVQENLLDEIYLSNWTTITPQKGTIKDTLNISCQVLHSNFKYTGGIQYYDALKEEYNTVKYLSNINILDNSFYLKIRNYKGIQDTLTFPITKEDDFIAKTLLSIVIYKKNHQKTKLTSEDYRHIFYELFKEPINIEKEIQKDIPKTLKYIPKKKVNL
jgi:hypothetical protein